MLTRGYEQGDAFHKDLRDQWTNAKGKRSRNEKRALGKKKNRQEKLGGEEKSRKSRQKPHEGGVL